MRKSFAVALAIASAAAGVLLSHRMETVQADVKRGTGFAAIPGQKGGQDMFGGYDVVKGWPKDISTVARK